MVTSASVALTLLVVAANPKVAMLSLRGTGVDESQASFLSEHVAQHLRKAELDVVTEREISSLVGMDRQRQLLGCPEEAGTCMAELASALGADAIAMGDLAQLEPNVFQVNVKLISSRNGALLAARSGRVKGLSALTDALGRAGFEIGRDARATLRPAEPVPQPLGLRRYPVRGWSLLGVAAMAVGGAVAVAGFIDTSFVKARLTPGEPGRLTVAEAEGLAQRGQRSQSWAVAGVALAGAGALAAALLFCWAEEPPALALAFDGGGGALWVRGSF